MNIHFAAPEAIHDASRLLKEGALVAFPTETVYGLGADATNDRAVKAIFEAKGRPSNNPLILHVSSPEKISNCIDISRCSKRTLENLNLLMPFWPGPLSVILPKASHISSLATGGGDTVAVRIPNHPVALSLLELCPFPVAAPSANRSTYISPTTAEHVYSGIGSKVSLILDGGPCGVGIESTVLSLMEETPVIMRPGYVTKEQIEERLDCHVEIKSSTTHSNAPHVSPGLLLKHYAPHTPVKLIDSLVLSDYTTSKKIGVILFDETREIPFDACVTRYASKSNDTTEVAQHLFNDLRSLDNGQLDLIVVDTCERSGIGIAIMDRLLRASYRE